MSLEDHDAPILSVLKYMSQSDRLLEIPPWQREYVWNPSENGEVGELLSDLKSFLESDETDYLLGSIFLSKGAKKSENRLLIDGQQRSLTLTLFFMACRKYLSTANLLEPTNAAHATLLVDLISTYSVSHYEFFPRLSMTQGRANEILRQLFTWSFSAEGLQSDVLVEDKDTMTPTQKNIISVITWIYEKKLKTESWLPKEQLLGALRRILDDVKLIQVTLSNEQEAIAVFDRINSRGSRLDSGDLIKNRIFQKVPDGDQFDAVTLNWAAMMDDLVKCKQTRMKEPKFLLRALALRDAKIPNLSDADSDSPDTKQDQLPKITYEQLVPYWSAKLAEPDEFHNSGKIKALDFSKELAKAAQNLRKISEELNPRTGDTRSSHLYFLRFLKSVQHYPMLLAGAEIKSKDVYSHLARQVFNRTAFYLLSDEKNQDFEALVPTWTAHIRALGADATVSQLDKIYDKHVKVNDKQLIALRESMLLWTYKDSTDRRKIRAVLSLLSLKMDFVAKKPDGGAPDSYYKTTKEEGKSWDIDHVSPGGKAPKGSPLHRIGNLVLLHPLDNRSAGDKPAFEKFENYAGSHLQLTMSIAAIRIGPDKKKFEQFCVGNGVVIPDLNLETWDEDQMDLRAEFYWQLLRHELTSTN